MSHLLVLRSLVAGWQQPATLAIDLTVNAGEVVGLTGPNGAGKSTVLAAIAGRATVFSGKVQRQPGLRIALQTQALPPVAGLPLSGRELLAMTGADPAGLPPWLAERLDSRLDRLSGGQCHYLTLWAVLAAPSDLIMLDEPTNNLDRAGVAHLAQHLRTLAGVGRGVLVVSHDAAFVASVCDRLVALEPADVA